MKHLSIRQISLIILFIGALFFPIFNSHFKIIKDTINTENRQPASRPDFSYNSRDTFPSLYEKYYSDNFTIRQILIKDYYEFNLVLFKKSPHPDQVIIGKNEWLFMGGDENKSYIGAAPLTNEELEAFKNELEYRQKYLNDRNIRFYFVIAPIKASIYPEYLPTKIFQSRNTTLGQQLITYLQQNSTIPVIDLHPTLREAKKGGNVYYKLDNHWNYRAALYVTKEIIKKMQIDFPELQAPQISNYIQKIRTSRSGGNLTFMLAQTELYTDSIYEFDSKIGFKAVDLPKVGYPVTPGFPYAWDFELHKGIPGSSLPKLLIIADSYTNYVFPFIGESFSKTTKIFDNWQYKLNKEIVNLEKPNIVLLVVWEANLRNILLYPAKKE